MNGEVNYEKIHDCPSGTERLFKVMMRLEFALKETGWCTERAVVNWDKFANECLRKSFFDEIKGTDKFDVLITSPPKHQVADDKGFLKWKDANKVSNVQDLVGALRRVRNNLFHGGKSGDTDKNRNDTLVKNALDLIDEILQRHEEIRSMFEGDY